MPLYTTNLEGVEPSIFTESKKNVKLKMKVSDTLTKIKLRSYECNIIATRHDC